MPLSCRCLLLLRRLSCSEEVPVLDRPQCMITFMNNSSLLFWLGNHQPHLPHRNITACPRAHLVELFFLFLAPSLKRDDNLFYIVLIDRFRDLLAPAEYGIAIEPLAFFVRIIVDKAHDGKAQPGVALD